MVLRCYLAMTAAEYQSAPTLPEHIAWMACHFSSYGLGLSNMPTSLPVGSMIMINDRTPIHKHDPAVILQQLSTLTDFIKPSCFLLDFQRPDQTQSYDVAKLLSENLPCPVGVSEIYAKDLNCPVFLSSPPLHVSLQDYLKPGADREIWLEASLDAQNITVTKEGSIFQPAGITPLDQPIFEENTLHCLYHTELTDNAAIFHLQRDRKQLDVLMEEAMALGVTQCVGLYQQLRKL